MLFQHERKGISHFQARHDTDVSSLERVGVVTVTPFVISGLGETGRVQVATNQGALRMWFRPYWGSGSGPGIPARLAEFAAVEGSQAAVLWSLQVSADGSALRLVGPGGNGVLLEAEIDWAAVGISSFSTTERMARSWCWMLSPRVRRHWRSRRVWCQVGA